MDELIAVTGASGHIGGNLVRALLAQNKKVRAIIHDDDRALRGLPGLEVCRADVCDPTAISEALSGARVVFHLAARISIMGDEGGRVPRVNVGGTRHVVAACLSHKVRRLVHFSSIHAIDQHPLSRPVDEENGPSVHPSLPAYDRSKAQGEAEVQMGIQKGLDAVIVNPMGVIGPHDYGPSRMGEVLLGLYHRRMPMLVRGGFNWVDVRDVVSGALAALERGRTGHRYILGGHYYTIPEMAKLASSITGIPAPRASAPMWLARIGVPFVMGYAQVMKQRPLYTGEALLALRANPSVRLDKAASELGYTRRPFEETLADTYAWFQEAGMLRAAAA